MSVNYCSVDGCLSKIGDGLSFFRCPKDEKRILVWKKALSFIGEHRYANLTADQCNNRIRICSLHFNDNCFSNAAHNRIHKYAIPSLSARTFTRENNQSCDTVILSKNMVEASTQTDFDYENSRCQKCYDATVTKQTEEYTQTSTKLSAGTPRKLSLKRRIRFLEKEANSSKKSLDKEISLEDIMQFCEKKYSGQSLKLLKAQLYLLNKSPKGSRYTTEFKQFAFSIYCLGPKAYKKMSTIFRLPSKSTLERFTKQWVVDPGFNELIFRVIEQRVRILKDKEKDCLLCLDEISLKSHLFYNVSKYKIIGFEATPNKQTTEIANYALVVMVTGIGSNWKQPLAYFFYKLSAPSADLKTIIFESVRKLTAIGLNVLGTTSDQGSNFVKLVKSDLKLTENRSYFFVDNVKFVYIFDVPHLLKSTRNNFFSYIFKLSDSETKKCYLETMYNMDKTKQFKLAPRLSNDHMYPNNFQKMKVKLATQIFSHSVGVAMHTYINFQVLPKDATGTANFILKMNDLFDLLNSNSLESFQAFMATETQKNFLIEIDNLFKDLHVLNMKGKPKLTLKVFTNDYANLKSPEGNALVYVAGYILKKCLLQHSCQTCSNFASSNSLLNDETMFCRLKAFNSEKKPFGGLTMPHKDIVDAILDMEDICIKDFNNMAGQNKIGEQYKNKFSSVKFHHPCKDFPYEYFNSLYTRVRIYFTLKFLNQEIKATKIPGNKDRTVQKLTILRNL